MPSRNCHWLSGKRWFWYMPMAFPCERSLACWEWLRRQSNNIANVACGIFGNHWGWASMPDLERQLRNYIDWVAPPIGVEEVLSGDIRLVPQQTLHETPRRPYWLGASVTAVVVVVVALAMVLARGSVAEPAVDPLTPVDPCLLIEQASDRAGLHITNPPGADFRHEHGTWDAATCALGWDGSWADRHLLIREVATSLAEAGTLVSRGDLLDGVDGLAWEAQRPGFWVLTQDPPRGFQAVAVSADPYFFIVTDGSLVDAMAVAEAVLIELGLEEGDVQ